jgi:hypothetical protein
MRDKFGGGHREVGQKHAEYGNNNRSLILGICHSKNNSTTRLKVNLINQV